MIAAAVSNGRVKINNCIPEHVEPITAKLREAGIIVNEGDDYVEVFAKQRPGPIDIKTLPYPGFPTDMQPQMMVLMAVANGTSIVSESIFENRYKHVDELRRLGAQIKLEGKVSVVNGVPRLNGALVEATDLRAGAALIIAGLSRTGSLSRSGIRKH